MSALLPLTKTIRARLVLGTALAGAVFASYGGRPAHAGTCIQDPPGSGIVICSGPAIPGDTTQNLSGDQVTATTEPGFGITTAAGTALEITSNQGQSFIDANSSAIKGKTIGIKAENDGTGDITIETTGAVAGVTDDGIQAYNINGENLTISAASVSGGEDGIYAKNSGTGSLSITATGAVTGNGGNGIDARNYGTDLTINATSVSGYTDAVYAKNNGTGALSITASGPLTSATRDGISARNASPNGTDLTIDVADVTADNNGIYAKNYGQGTLTISAGAVSGGNVGIFARNDGSGSLSVTTAGQVTGGTGQGIGAFNTNGGSLTISASDRVSSTDNYGIQAKNDVTGNDLTIVATTVSGGYGGIYAKNLGTGDLNVTASGPVTASAGAGINAYGSDYGQNVIVSAASVDGEYDGIFAVNEGFGALEITATGTVTGGMDGDGIFGQNTGTSLTINAVDVFGDGNGIGAQNFGSGALSITAGTVTATDNSGVYAKNYYGSTDLTISVAGAHGGETGIDAKNYGMGALSITASGPVSGTGQVGIYGKNLGTDLIIDAAGASGGTYGIAAVNEGTGDLNISTTGPVSGGTTGILADNTNGGSVTIDVTGKVSGGTATGIDTSNDDQGADLTIIAASDVTGGVDGIIADSFGTGALSITVSGAATGGGNNGIFGQAHGTDLTVSVGSAYGYQDGLYTLNHGTGSSTITATGTVTGGTNGGITAKNYNAESDNVSITAIDVYGHANGIIAENQGTGSITITTTGNVVASGDYSFGIDVLNVGDGPVSITTGIGTTVSGGNNGIAVETETSDVLLQIASTVIGGDGVAIDAIFVGGDTRLELQPGYGFDDDFVRANSDPERSNLLVLGGPSGEATFDLALLDDGDYTPEGDEQIFGFQPIFLKEDESNFLLTGTNALPFEAASVMGGVLALDGADIVLADGVPFMIGPDGALAAIGEQTLTGDVINQGTILLANNGFDPIAGLDGTDDVLTIEGDYTAGSALYLNTFLNDGKEDITDLLVVEGDTSGETEVFVTNTGGPGGLTGDGPTDGILVVEVGGASDGSFVLGDEVIAGVFEYDLRQADGQNWYLQFEDYIDQAYVYESLPSAIQTIGLALAGQLVERVGVRSGAPSPLTTASGDPLPGGGPVTSGLWLRGVGQWLESEGDLDSTTGASFDQTTGFVQGGGEVVVAEGASGRLLIGALAHWGTSSVDVDDAAGRERGSSDIDFYGGGLTATWYGAGGLYVDGLVQYTAYDIDVSTSSRFSSTSTDGDGFTVSGEVGYRVPISATAALVPQAQLTWQSIDFDDFVDPDGIRVSLDDGDSLVGRLGLAAEANWAAGDALVTGYAEANLLHEFLGDNTVLASGTALSQDLGGTSVEFGVGTTVAFNETLSLYGEVDYTIPFDNGVEGLQAVAGLRWSFAPPPPPPPPAPVVAPVAETAFIVFFDWDRADLTSEANLVLDDVVVVANQSGYASIRLDGYTDLSGSAQYNLGLSERRANSVANGLIARGIAPDEIVIRAFGEENPLVPTPDGVREPQNRRVEIFLS